jgi:3-hydroxyacyl-CoA dehydrogenase/enoyl-CoA hydratase/3-hydroxybutyryl-CoA epimerase/enoyl-CoA isomerase
VGPLQAPQKYRRLTTQTNTTSVAAVNITPTVYLNFLKKSDFVLEAITESLDEKSKLFTALNAIVPTNTILASNTSTISISKLAQNLDRPERFVGVHFFNPVERMQLVEIIRGTMTNDETVLSAVALAKRIGKTPIVVKDCPGFLVNRLLFPYM